jgi:leader peptidase (prepilin peptidase)/N-methyltransferase
LLSNLEPLSSSPGAYAFVVVLGLVWGSFANVCIYRWPPSEAFPHGRSVVRPGSHCFACGKPIRWYDNVPLLSYLWLRGRCRDCQASFSARYLLVELVTGALFGVAWWFTMHANLLFEPFSVRLERFVIDAAFCFAMVVIAFIDLDTRLVLNKFVIPATIVMYPLSLLLPNHTWYDGLIGIGIGYGLPWLIGEVYYRVRKQEGLGLGDAVLLAFVGSLLGWQGVFVSLFGGSVLGSLFSIRLLFAKRDEPEPGEPGEGDDEPATSLGSTELAFAPYLCMAAVFYLFAEPWITVHFRFAVG